jgi:hypothetical protein
MDAFHERMIGKLRARHESRIAENAERIRDHIGYVLKRIEAGRASATGMYADDIAASARRILLSVVALETLSEAGEILATADEPEAFEMDEARDVLARWDAEQGGEPVISREKVLADQVRALLAIVDQRVAGTAADR